MLQPKFTDALSLYKGKNRGRELPLGIKEVDDKLLGGGIEPGSFAIFHGSDRQESGIQDKTGLLDLVLYRLLANSLQPGEKDADSMPVLLNCGDYHNTQALLDLQLVTRLLKQNGLDPSVALDQIVVVSAFNPEQAERGVEELRDRLMNDKSVGPIIVREMPRLFLGDRQKTVFLERMAVLQHLIARLWQACAQQHVSLIVSTSATTPLRFRSASPTTDLPAGTMLKHMAQIIVSLRPRDGGIVEARLWKHPYMKPNTVRFEMESMRHSDPVLGRLSPAFREQLQKEIQALSRSFRQALMDTERKEAFDSLVKAWTSEKGSMSHAEAASTIEVMLLSAIVDNRKILANIQKRLDKLESQISQQQH